MAYTREKGRAGIIYRYYRTPETSYLVMNNPVWNGVCPELTDGKIRLVPDTSGTFFSAYPYGPGCVSIRDHTRVPNHLI